MLSENSDNNNKLQNTEYGEQSLHTIKQGQVQQAEEYSCPMTDHELAYHSKTYPEVKIVLEFGNEITNEEVEQLLQETLGRKILDKISCKLAETALPSTDQKEDTL